MSDGAPVYVLDADVLIQAARGYYAFDIAPGFWQALLHHAQTGKLISIDRVRDELNRGNDQLKRWANRTFSQWFAPTDKDNAVINAYKRIMEWAENQQQFTGVAKAEFADAENADVWVVAYSLVNGCVVVTMETFEPTVKKKIKIPNVYREFNVPYINTFEMLRELGVRLG